MEPGDKTKTDAPAGEPGQNQVRVNWDTSRLKTTYANVCNVSSTREEITLLFGTNQTWHAAQRELTVELTDRVILNPYAAKRLSVVLASLIQQYESRYGELPLEERK